MSVKKGQEEYKIYEMMVTAGSNRKSTSDKLGSRKSLVDQSIHSQNTQAKKNLTGANRVETNKHEQDAGDVKSSHGIRLATRRRPTHSLDRPVRCTAVSKALDLNDAPEANPCGEMVRKK